MGLDVTAHERLRFLEPAYKPWTSAAYEAHDAAEHVHLYKIRGVPDRADGVKQGWYEPLGDEYSFHAGSYSYYDTWRDQLAAMMGTTPKKLWETQKPGPFMELIAFADNEGYFGPRTSKKLAIDFIEQLSRAIEFAKTLENPRDFLDNYRGFSKAFALAAETGVVEFR